MELLEINEIDKCHNLLAEMHKQEEPRSTIQIAYKFNDEVQPTETTPVLKDLITQI